MGINSEVSHRLDHAPAGGRALLKKNTLSRASFAEKHRRSICLGKRE